MEKQSAEYSLGIAANTRILPYLKIPELIDLVGDRSEIRSSCHIRKNSKNENRFVSICNTGSTENFYSVMDDLVVFFNKQYNPNELGNDLRFVIGVFMEKDKFSASAYFEQSLLKALSELNMDLEVEMYPG